jgi:hypothetical protein
MKVVLKLTQRAKHVFGVMTTYGHLGTILQPNCQHVFGNSQVFRSRWDTDDPWAQASALLA